MLTFREGPRSASLNIQRGRATLKLSSRCLEQDFNPVFARCKPVLCIVSSAVNNSLFAGLTTRAGEEYGGTKPDPVDKGCS